MEAMQAEANRRADAMIQAVMQMLKHAPATENDREAPAVETDAKSGRETRTTARQGQQQPMQAVQPSWAAVTRTGTQKTSSWTPVTNGKKKVKKHTLDQRRILFVRNIRPHTCDPRDILFKVNKALANARAQVTARLVQWGTRRKVIPRA
jgi:hypothetical protein